MADDGKVTPLTVKVGDEILYGKYSGTELNLEGKDYMIMRESDIYAVLNRTQYRRVMMRPNPSPKENGSQEHPIRH